MQECFVSRNRPVVRWWPQVTLPDGTVGHNVATVGENDRAVTFLLEFEGQVRPVSSSTEWPCLVVRENVFRGPVEQWADYLRRKVLLWLLAGCKSAGEAHLRGELRRWRESQGFDTNSISRTRVPWSPSEELELVSAARQGTSVIELARLHGRTPDAIKTRLGRLAA